MKHLNGVKRVHNGYQIFIIQTVTFEQNIHSLANYLTNAFRDTYKNKLYFMSMGYRQ